MSAPPAPAYTGPAFLFEGDTFAVPSWEFRCELPPTSTDKSLPPHTATVDVFGVTWTVYRVYWNRIENYGALIVSPSGRGMAIRPNGLSGFHSVAAHDGTFLAEEPEFRTPDEFMHALKAIAERNGE